MKISFQPSALIIALLICLGCSPITADTPKDEIRIFRGELQVMIADDFKTNTAQAVYHLISAENGAMLRLNFTHSQPDPMLKTGTQVEVQGRLHGDRLDVMSLQLHPSTNK